MNCAQRKRHEAPNAQAFGRNSPGDCFVASALSSRIYKPTKTAPVRRQALFGVEHYYFFGTRRSVPPIYGCKALGTSTLPSACKLFSKKAMSILGGATTVLFRVWAR